VTSRRRRRRPACEDAVVLFLHETHSVVGRCEEEFEEAFRGPDGYMERLADGGDARLLWYLDHAHGTGPAYTVVTVTAVRDGAGWERLATRVAEGDLREWVGQVDRLRHDATAKLLRPLPWSALQEVDLATVPVKPDSRDLVLFMEDTANPHQGMVHDYIEVAGSQYAPSLRRANPLLEMVAAFQPAFGAGRRREIVLWQRVADPRALLRLLTTTIPPQMKAPGTWMHDALDVRDQWTSRLLRTSAWSPMA
jgi:hypothetical protein